MKNSNNSIKSFIREIAIVVIGILIALFINNWNEKIKHEKFINKTLYAISEEIRYSKNDIEEVLRKHYKTINALNASYDDTDESIRDFFIKMEGFQIPEVKNIGLRFFIANSAELVDYEVISDLSEIEFISKGFEMKHTKLSDFLYANLNNTEKKNKEIVADLLIELTDSEEDLVELYENFLLKHKASLQQSTKRQ